jgi:hypothetical protein
MTKGARRARPRDPERLRACGALMAVLCSAACATGRTLAPSPFDETASVASSFRVNVENQNSLDARIYVLGDGANPRRVGDVPGNGGTRSFEVPWNFAGDLSFRIDLVAGPSCLTYPVPVGPGDVIGLQIVVDFSSAYCR